jgi:hypothetical protein
MAEEKDQKKIIEGGFIISAAALRMFEPSPAVPQDLALGILRGFLQEFTTANHLPRLQEQWEHIESPTPLKIAQIILGGILFRIDNDKSVETRQHALAVLNELHDHCLKMGGYCATLNSSNPDLTPEEAVTSLRNMAMYAKAFVDAMREAALKDPPQFTVTELPRKPNKAQIVQAGLEIFWAITQDIKLSLPPEMAAEHLEAMREHFTYEEYAPEILEKSLEKGKNDLKPLAPLKVATYLLEKAIEISASAISREAMKHLRADARIIQSATETLQHVIITREHCKFLSTHRRELNSDPEAAIKELLLWPAREQLLRTTEFGKEGPKPQKPASGRRPRKKKSGPGPGSGGSDTH